MTTEALLGSIRRLQETILGSRLTGCYLHGSLALGCFHWSRSDVDFLTVVSEEPSQSQKEALIAGLLQLESQAPPKGLEMSVLCQDDCKPFRYPTPYALHYSRMHRARAMHDLASYCHTMRGTDKDLAAHIAVLRQSGVVLCGKAIAEVFDPVPQSCYLDSVLEDIGPDASLSQDPAYTLLNLCRTWAFLENGRILSKRQGGEWALGRLSPDEVKCIQAALSHYGGKASVFPPAQDLQACAAGLLSRVRQLLPQGQTENTDT